MRNTLIFCCLFGFVMGLILLPFGSMMLVWATLVGLAVKWSISRLDMHWAGRIRSAIPGSNRPMSLKDRRLDWPAAAVLVGFSIPFFTRIFGWT